MRRNLSAMLVVAALAVLAPAAGAAPPPAGGLEALSCTANPAYAADLGCASGSAGLVRAHDLALSPDGRQLYVAAEGEESVVDGRLLLYPRDPQSGALAAPSCLGPPAVGCVDAPQLGALVALDLAPDGSDVYVAAYDKGVVRYRRDANGGLSFAECITPDAVGGCTLAPGLHGANDVAVSPDGKSVYVASYSDNALVFFERDETTGELTFASCWRTGGPAATCTDVSGAIGANALDSATGVDVAPDGSRVLVSSRGGDAVTVFDRAASGALTDPQSLSADYLEGAQTVAASPAGGTAYAGLFDGAGLTALRIDGAGTPSLLGCFAATATADCAQSPGVSTVFGLAFSPDGGMLYAAARNGSTVSAFRRAADGALSLVDCTGTAVPAFAVSLEAGCRQGNGGLAGAEAVAASADGRFVYTVGSLSLATLRPERAPVCSPLTRRVPNDRATELRVRCTDADGQPLTFALASQPSRGRASVVNGATGLLRYTPSGRFAGRTGFRFAASDGTNSGAADVGLTVFRTPPKLAIPAKRLRLTARGRLKVELRCLPGVGGCRGTLTARSARKLKGGGGKRSFVKLGSRRFSIASGRAKTVTLKVPASGRAAIAAAGRLGVRLSIVARDRAGNRGTKAKRIVVLPPRPLG